MEVFSLFAAKVQTCANTAMISRGKVQSFIVLFTAAQDQAHPYVCYCTSGIVSCASLQVNVYSGAQLIRCDCDFAKNPIRRVVPDLVTINNTYTKDDPM